MLSTAGLIPLNPPSEGRAGGSCLEKLHGTCRTQLPAPRLLELPFPRAGLNPTAPSCIGCWGLGVTASLLLCHGGETRTLNRGSWEPGGLQEVGLEPLQACFRRCWQLSAVSPLPQG